MPIEPRGGLSRRSYLSSGALILTATAVIHPIKALGLEPKGLGPPRCRHSFKPRATSIRMTALPTVLRGRRQGF